MMRTIAVILTLAVAAVWVVLGCTPVPKPYCPPDKTLWSPQGCRAIPADDPVLGSRTHFRNIHGDAMNTDEVSIALTPVFHLDWVAEPEKYNFGGPVFDSQGNIYFTPVWPTEEVLLISLDPDDGSRRWAIPGVSSTLGSPMVGVDPDTGQEIVYLGLYGEAMAVRPDGTVLWRKPTGLDPDPGANPAVLQCFGVNYHPGADALLGITGDGRIYALDRETGDPVFAAPFLLPGEPSPAKALEIPLPQIVLNRIREELDPLLGGAPFPDPLTALMQILLGGETEVANFFSVDPVSGRIWIAATAPDGEDGTVDGVSELGALYGLDLITEGGPPYAIEEACHLSFQGGSASTPSLRAHGDGLRIYVGDEDGTLIAIDQDCEEIWSLELGNQIVGSIGVASDMGELYVATARDIVKVVDRGSAGEEIWRAVLDMYDTGPWHDNFNLDLATIGANGVIIQVGAGILLEDMFPLELGLPLEVGVALLDRETGRIRYFAEGLEETIAVMNVGPDGALYHGHSPLRRAFARGVFPNFTHPLTAGIGKFGPLRLDLLIRDAACAAADRARNAFLHGEGCPEAASADIRDIADLITQCRRSSAGAISDGDLTPEQWTTLDGYLTDAEAHLGIETLAEAAVYLDEACRFFD